MQLPPYPPRLPRPRSSMKISTNAAALLEDGLGIGCRHSASMSASAWGTPSMGIQDSISGFASLCPSCAQETVTRRLRFSREGRASRCWPSLCSLRDMASMSMGGGGFVNSRIGHVVGGEWPTGGGGFDHLFDGGDCCFGWGLDVPSLSTVSSCSSSLDGGHGHTSLRDGTSHPSIICLRAPASPSPQEGDALRPRCVLAVHSTLGSLFFVYCGDKNFLFRQLFLFFASTLVLRPGRSNASMALGMQSYDAILSAPPLSFVSAFSMFTDTLIELISSDVLQRRTLLPLQALSRARSQRTRRTRS
ncbi:hypothetical protein B0H12DRAFT_1130250 [Mycena haematopus]|nr:hypothetical protein B0H12DRAFT_1130250 [Mycena haematopus]